MSETDRRRRASDTGTPGRRLAIRPGPVRLPVRFQQVLPLSIALGPGQSDGRAAVSARSGPGTRPFPAPRRSIRPFARYQAPPGSVVLCPSYNCGHEIEPLLRLGLRPKWYRVGPDLETDLDDIRRRFTEEVRAVLVTHFFGFAQPAGRAAGPVRSMGGFPGRRLRPRAPERQRRRHAGADWRCGGLQSPEDAAVAERRRRPPQCTSCSCRPGVDDIRPD